MCVPAANKPVYQVTYTFMTPGNTLQDKYNYFKANICPQTEQYNMHSMLREQELKAEPYFDCR
jgi:hypothetical protein